MYSFQDMYDLVVELKILQIVLDWSVVGWLLLTFTDTRPRDLAARPGPSQGPHGTGRPGPALDKLIQANRFA